MKSIIKKLTLVLLFILVVNCNIQTQAIFGGECITESGLIGSDCGKDKCFDKPGTILNLKTNQCEKYPDREQSVAKPIQPVTDSKESEIKYSSLENKDKKEINKTYYTEISLVVSSVILCLIIVFFATKKSTHK